jgi:hypothetical protein
MWLVVSVVMLLFTILGISMLWPEKDDALVRDIAAPACQVWLKLPAGFVPDEVPSSSSECHSLTSFLRAKNINLSTEGDYDKYLSVARLKLVFAALGIWLGTVFALFVFGWSVGWVIAGFRAKRV